MDVPLKKTSSGKRPKKKRFQGNMYRKKSLSEKVSGDGTWKTRGHTSLIGVCALIGADCGKVLDMEVMSSYCQGCDSYKGPKFGPKYSAFLAKHQIFCRKNHSGSAGGMEVCGMQKIFSDQNKTWIKVSAIHR
ncbi:uncharacterized protein TNCV_3435781 [Trichonephila clavipes]|nr:uncharacterized protein TNCV_3435781 [Trichonephila clavipes]